MTMFLTMILAINPPAGYDPAPILSAIRSVESGGNDSAVGDKGKAKGGLQIWWSYWKDAYDFDPSLGGRYEDCTNRAYADRVVLAYMSRYAPDWKPETIARIHNGGRNGMNKKSTVKYWIKVKRVLDRSQK